MGYKRDSGMPARRSGQANRSYQDYHVRMEAFYAIAACFDAANPSVYKAVVSGLKDKDPSVQAAACRAVAELEADWKWVKWRLRFLARSKARGIQLDAIIALCVNWPEMVTNRRIREWLEENSGYWWAQALLDGKSAALLFRKPKKAYGL